VTRTGSVRVLILGGTGEARALARALDARGTRVVTSLAGRTGTPAALPGEVRTGGFGGPAGLVRALEEGLISHVVDATHPFAARIGQHAAVACEAVGRPRVRLLRPPWPRKPGDRWHEVAGVQQAATLLPMLGGRVLLTTGQEGLASFGQVPDVILFVRSIEPPPDLPAGAVWIGARGPFRLEDENRLLKSERIDVLVSKQSGGAATYPKIVAARQFGLPVVMLERPPLQAGPVVETVEQALAWLDQSDASRTGRST
jgi:precorrin-6A/cobalt-precorrin-6A reductase